MEIIEMPIVPHPHPIHFTMKLFHASAQIKSESRPAHTIYQLKNGKSFLQNNFPCTKKMQFTIVDNVYVYKVYACIFYTNRYHFLFFFLVRLLLLKLFPCECFAAPFLFLCLIRNKFVILLPHSSLPSLPLILSVFLFCFFCCVACPLKKKTLIQNCCRCCCYLFPLFPLLR